MRFHHRLECVSLSGRNPLHPHNLNYDPHLCGPLEGLAAIFNPLPLCPQIHGQTKYVLPPAVHDSQSLISKPPQTRTQCCSGRWAKGPTLWIMLEGCKVFGQHYKANHRLPNTSWLDKVRSHVNKRDNKGYVGAPHSS